MFGGIVETIGCILQIKVNDGCKHFTIFSGKFYKNFVVGESIAVNGVCLTVTEFSEESFDVTAVPETLRLTNLDQLKIGTKVNLERAMMLSSRLGGHYVQGHVDAVGEVMNLNFDNSNAMLIKIRIPNSLSKYAVNKGYIALDGMSITIIEAKEDWILVTLIPHTQAVTIAKYYGNGTKINIEVDLMGKYIEKLLEAKNNANTN